MMSRKTMALLGATAVALLGGIAAVTRSPGPSAPASPPPAIVEPTANGDGWKMEIARLRNALDLERRERAELGAEVQRLRDRMRVIETRAVRAPGPRAANDERRQARESDRATSEHVARKPAGLDTAAIIAAGFEPTEVQAFRSQMDQIELERLYLRDVAAREGWLGTQRFREENRELSDSAEQVRAEFSEDLYDWMLYASGHPNRVGVAEVIAGSAAADAGVQAGDVILRYDDERVFDFRELRDRTRAGTAGDPTTVDLVRNGREISVTVPRGPLGGRLEPRAEEPPPAG
jgi:hypothetical protein